MNGRLPRLTVAALLLAAGAFIALKMPRDDASDVASPPSPNISTQPPIADWADSSTTTVGDKLLLQAAAQLERRSSIKAHLRHQSLLGDKPLYGVGTYWQQGSGDELCVKLELQIVGQDSTLRQVSNSRFLWVDRRLPTGREVTRIDLRQLRTDSVLNDSPLGELVPGEASWSSVALVAHRGGLPSLLASLSENFSFLAPQAMRLAVQKADGATPSSIPVFAIVGHWKSEQLKTLLPGSTKIQMDSLPERIPQEVLILLGQADLFPYRIEYRRLQTPRFGSQESSTIPYQLSTDPIVVMDVADVEFDSPIANGEFDYSPGDTEWIDQTASVLEALRLQRQKQLAAKSSIATPTPRAR